MKYKTIYIYLIAILLLIIVSACSSSTSDEVNNESSSNNNEVTETEGNNEDEETEESEEIDEVYERIKEKGVIEAGSTPTGPPFTFLNPETNEIEGIMVDIGKRVAEELGLELNVNSVQFTSLIPSLEGGKIDMIVAGLARTEEREKVIDFTDTVYTYGEVIVIKKENDEIRTLEDLYGKTLGVQEASTSFEELKAYPEINVKTYKTQQDMAKELEFGRIDAFMPDLPVYNNMLKEMPDLKEKFKFAPDHESQWLHDIGLGVPKGATKLLEDVNEIIRELKENGELDEIIAKWDTTE